MGWTPDGQLWVTTRGGDVLISPEAGVSDKFEDKRIGSRGFGILDVGWVKGWNALECISRLGFRALASWMWGEPLHRPL